MLKKLRRHSLILLLVTFLAVVTVLWWQHAGPPRVAVPAPVVTVETLAVDPTREIEMAHPLNIELPQEQLLLDPKVEIPEQQSPLKPLFKIEEKPSTVAVGGGLIIEEDPKNPEAPLWDQVKGAKVEVEVKMD